MKKELYKLDNAAKIYPAVMTKKWNAVYRVSAYMTDDINIDSLKQAVCDLAPRFPTFYVQLHKGAFWDMLKRVDDFDIVEPETGCPCRPMQVGNSNKPMFRVLYGEKKISIEFFHSVTDGTGATIYLKTLLARYLELNGYAIEKECGVLDINEAPKQGEIEDAFQKVYSKDKKASRKEDDSYQYTPEKKENFLQVISGIIPIDQLKALTKTKYNCTITEYLAAVYAYSFLQQYLKESKTKEINKPIKISVPVNLRSYFETETLRNFASYVNVDINPKTTKTLPAIIAQVKERMADLNQKDKIECAVSQNVAEEKMIISKYSPNFLKKPIMKICFYKFGERKYTSPFSNVGLVKIPDSMKPHVERFEFIIGEMPVNRVYCTAVGLGNLLTVTISAVTEKTELQDFFFAAIRKDGIIFETTNTKKQKHSIKAA